MRKILSPWPVQRAAKSLGSTSTTDPHSMATSSGKALTLPFKALYRITEAMELLSMSRTVIYTQIRTGRLRTVQQGRSRLIPASAINDYVALLEAEAA